MDRPSRKPKKPDRNGRLLRLRKRNDGRDTTFAVPGHRGLAGWGGGLQRAARRYPPISLTHSARPTPKTCWLCNPGRAVVSITSGPRSSSIRWSTPRQSRLIEPSQRRCLIDAKSCGRLGFSQAEASGIIPVLRASGKGVWRAESFFDRRAGGVARTCPRLCRRAYRARR